MEITKADKALLHDVINQISAEQNTLLRSYNDMCEKRDSNLKYFDDQLDQLIEDEDQRRIILKTKLDFGLNSREMISNNQKQYRVNSLILHLLRSAMK